MKLLATQAGAQQCSYAARVSRLLTSANQPIACSERDTAS